MRKLIGNATTRSVLLLVVVGASIGVWQGVAGASTKASENTIWFNRNECATEPHTQSIGDVRLTRIGGKRLQVRVSLVNAEPNTDFEIWLYSKASRSASSCKEAQLFDIVTTDSSGKWKGAFTSNPKTDKYFFIAAFNTDTNQWNETDWLAR
jgi:hypothetical protein